MSETVAAYLAAQPPAARKVLAQVRAAIRAAAPTATECISYRMPAYKADGMLIFFAGFKAHYALYPATPGVIAAGGKKLAPHLVAKGTMHFDYDVPVPTKLLTTIVKARLKENAAAAKAKAKAKAKKEKAASPRRSSAGAARAARPRTRR